MNYNYFIIGTMVLLICCIIAIMGFKQKKYKKRINEQENIIRKLEAIKYAQSPNLNFDEIIKIVDATIDEVWKNKYFLYYRLKEIKVIANMDEEVKNITLEVIESFDQSFIHAVMNYYTLDYFTKYITRKTQMLLVEYTNTYKPNTK